MTYKISDGKVFIVPKGMDVPDAAGKYFNYWDNKIMEPGGTADNPDGPAKPVAHYIPGYHESFIIPTENCNLSEGVEGRLQKLLTDLDARSAL
jgi:hypothetical protein